MSDRADQRRFRREVQQAQAQGRAISASKMDERAANAEYLRGKNPTEQRRQDFEHTRGLLNLGNETSLHSQTVRDTRFDRAHDMSNLFASGDAGGASGVMPRRGSAGGPPGGSPGGRPVTVSDLETLWKRLDESGGDVIESAQGGTKARMLADILNFGSEQGGQQGGLPFDNQTFKKSFLEMMKWQGHGNLGQDLGNAPAAWESLIAKELGRHTEQAYGQPQRQRNPNPIRHIQDPNNSKHHYFTNRYAESGDVDHMSPSSERLHGMIRNQWLDEQSAGGEGAAAGAAPGGEGAAAGLKLAAPGGRSGSIRMTNADKMLAMMEQGGGSSSAEAQRDAEYLDKYYGQKRDEALPRVPQNRAVFDAMKRGLTPSEQKFADQQAQLAGYPYDAGIGDVLDAYAPQLKEWIKKGGDKAVRALMEGLGWQFKE
jgi:hypothetical protein